MAGYNSMAEIRRKQAEEEEAMKKAKGEGKGTQSFYNGGESSGISIDHPPDDAWKQMEQHQATGPIDGAHQITLWRNGFTINNGPLRPLSDPLNQKFVDDIAKGEVPDELKPTDGSEEVPVSVHDQRSQDYTPPSAAGSSVAPRKPAVPAKIENAVAGGDGTVVVDASKPTTKIQVCFHDGSKKAQEFNHDHTIGDLRSFCQQVTGVPMTVKGGYPPKNLTDDSQTVKDAGLCGARITVQPA